jgi:HAD superfamily hydrolase (TIGR01509 family)
VLKALLIDLDGTLADSLPLLYQVYNEFLKGYHLKGSWEEFHTLNGLTLLEVMQTLVKKYNLLADPALLAKEYRGRLDLSYQENLPIFAFARQCLIYAKEKGLKLVLVTSAKRELAESFLKQHHLEKLMEEIITPDGNEKGKPAPDIYLKALKKLQIAPEEAIALEDAEHGIAAALAAKIPTVQFHGKTAQPVLLSVNGWVEFFQFLKTISTAHPEFSYYPIDAHFQVRVEESGPLPFTARMEHTWQEKCRQNPHLFNGKLFRFLSLDEKGLAGEFIDYKQYVVHLGDGSIIPVGVSGIVYTDEAVLIGRRTKMVLVGAGLFETPPSGTIDPEAQGGAQVDPLKQIAKELYEELSVKKEEVLSITPFALIEDKKGGTWEICFAIELKAKKEISSPNGEYENCFFVKRGDLLTFIEKHYFEILPFTRFLLANLL